MAMVGFSFTKINAEKKISSGQSVNIESNAIVTNITELPVIDSKKTILKFDFGFTVKYEPATGRIDINGEIVELYEREFGTKIIDLWKKDKKVLPEVTREIFNTILSKSNVEAVIISRDLGLPSPIQLPRVNVKGKEEAKTAEKPKAKK